MEFIQSAPDDSKELSEYLRPIWHEVYDTILHEGFEEAEYIFTSWTNPDEIRKSMEEGYVFGYMEVDGKRVGLYSYHILDDGRFYINKVYLESAYRGKGLGQDALAVMKRIAEENGCTEMFLNVYYTNERAISAYERFGFRKQYRCMVGLGRGYVRDDYLMGMDL